MSNPVRLIYLDASLRIRINCYLAIVIVGFVYFLSGSVFALLFYDEPRRITDLVALSFAALLLGGYLATARGGIENPTDNFETPAIRVGATGVRVWRIEFSLILAAYALLGLGLLFYAVVPVNYFDLDKVERAGALRQYYALRVSLFMSPVACYLALMHYRATRTACLRWLYGVYLVSYGLLSLVELNREMLLALGLLTLCWFARFNNWFPRFFPTQFCLVLLALAFFTVLKGVAYPILFGKEFEAGMFAIGEVINWVRWTNYAFEGQIDLAVLHANDWRYLLNAAVFPKSFYESSSAIWFRDVLGEDGIGQTYGYSGLLSWYSVSGHVGVVIIPLLIGFGAVKIDRSRSVVAAIASFGIALVAFRLFRSEYVLVIKTLLWQYFYPGVVVWFLARLRIH
jgi:hypothetical protein